MNLKEVFSLEWLISSSLCVLICVCFSPIVYAQHHGEAGNEFIEILSPTPGSILRDREFTLTLDFDPDAMHLDHAHYNIDVVGGEARDGVFTTPDLSGNVEVQLLPEQRDGRYEVCAYLADVAHGHLSQTVCNEFELRTSGATVVRPIQMKVYESNRVIVEISPFGEALEEVLEVTLNGSPLELNSDYVAEVVLANGSHTLSVQPKRSTGEVFGDTDSVTFEVQSPMVASLFEELLPELRKAKRLARKKRGKRKVTRLLGELRSSLQTILMLEDSEVAGRASLTSELASLVDEALATAQDSRRRKPRRKAIKSAFKLLSAALE